MATNGGNPSLTSFAAGDLVISVSGDGNGSGTYTDNQASPITLDEVTTTGALVGQLVLPQTTTTAGGTTEYAVSGEYGSSSEGSLELAANGQSLVIAGYGVNAATFNAAEATGGSNAYGNAALAQSTSLTTQTTYTPVARVVADIGANASVDTTTAIYNIYNTNNPRSVATVNGTTFYLSGQGVKGDTTQGVFTAHDGAGSATAIDTSTDTRTVEIYNGQLYVSRDSTQGTGGTSNIATYGTLPTGATADSVLPGIDGTDTLTAAQENTVNSGSVGQTIHLSPENYFFANATTLYVADGGNPKEGGIGDGGLQKWTLANGQWTLDYTLSQGLNLVPDTATSGTSGLIGLTGTVSGGTVQLYATNETIGDTDQTYLYGITDQLNATTAPTAESFTALVTAAPDTNIRGVAFAPSAGPTPTSTTVPSGSTQSGLTVTSGSTLTVLSGGAVVNTSILSGGFATISAGGSDSSASVAGGGSEVVLGSASGDQIDGSQLVSGAGAVVSGETVYDGGAVAVFAGGSAVNTTLTNGGDLVVSSGGSANNVAISSGGTITLEAPTAVLSGGVAFSGSGTILVTTVTSAGYGDLATISGFGVGDAVDDNAIGSGATLGTVVSGGNTIATISSGGVSQSYAFAGSVGSSLALISDGSGGEEIVFATPTTSNVVVSSGMTQSGLVISSGSTVTVSSGGSIQAATILSGGQALVYGSDTGSVISGGGSETVFGTASGDQVAGVQLVSAATAVVSNETVVNGGAVDLYLKGAVANAITVSGGGSLNISGNATANNTVVSGGGLVELQSPKAVVSGALTFAGAATLEETAVVSSGYGDLATISGFAAGDVIDLASIGTGATLSSAVTSGNTVETVTSGSVSEAFTFAGTYAANYFNLGAAPSGGGVALTAQGTPCYCPGTLILTDRGERPVESLRIGNVVVTASGALRPIRWIGRRAYAAQFASGQRHILPVTIAAGALGEGLPRRDLVVSPLHAMLIEDVLVPARALVNGLTVTQPMQRDRAVEYVHVELDSHDVILAEGAPSETFVDDHSRGMFHNAADYRALYPDAGEEEARYCAPRVEDGERLERLRARLLLLTGRCAEAPGLLDGRIDRVTSDRVQGWAHDASAPAVRIRLRLLVDGVVLRETLADRFRPDLEAAGIGDGHHAFDISVPGGLPAAATLRIERAEDAALLAEREVPGRAAGQRLTA